MARLKIKEVAEAKGIIQSRFRSWRRLRRRSSTAIGIIRRAPFRWMIWQRLPGRWGFILATC